ncbi:MAG TPA: DUF1385 domain-containing protein [Candidatus Limnocylindrales bacterium]|nr:DUF1385 domain-containing protein [Candidatus Limnocylindrales bacterium]
MNKPDQFFYGGQAVIEGVLMRGRTTYAVAVRRPDGAIQVKREPLRSVVYTSRVWKLPFLRGLAGLWEMLHLGMSALTYSANVQAAGEEMELSPRAIGVTIGVAVVLGLGLFLGVPLLAAGFLGRGHSALRFTLIEGVVRIVLLLGYLYAISLAPDVRRVFQYHGAEHKTINAFENGLTLDVPNIRTQSMLHPRCGTGFLLAVMVVSVFVFSLAGRPSLILLILSRLLLIPVIASVAYEGIRFAGRHRYNPVIKVLIIPLLATQRLTTREPDDSQLEVALAAFTAARQEETEAAA